MCQKYARKSQTANIVLTVQLSDNPPFSASYIVLTDNYITMFQLSAKQFIVSTAKLIDLQPISPIGHLSEKTKICRKFFLYQKCDMLELCCCQYIGCQTLPWLLD